MCASFRMPIVYCDPRSEMKQHFLMSSTLLECGPKRSDYEIVTHRRCH